MSGYTRKSGTPRRRQSKLVGFVVVEVLAIGVLVGTGIFAVWSRPIDSAPSMLINIVIIAAAAAVGLVPILFFAIAPLLPRGN
jgi:hypothetical protein